MLKRLSSEAAVSEEATRYSALRVGRFAFAMGVGERINLSSDSDIRWAQLYTLSL